MNGHGMMLANLVEASLPTIHRITSITMLPTTGMTPSNILSMIERCHSFEYCQCHKHNLNDVWQQGNWRVVLKHFLLKNADAVYKGLNHERISIRSRNNLED